MPSEKMTASERRAVASLSSIMGLRMIGLFMVIPVFSLYAEQLKGATPLLIGLALGIYGLSQALFQIPFGALSDRFGRKPLLLIGLLLFAIGSLIAAFSESITLMIIGRTLQGTGAIGSTTLAAIADNTRENQRTKSMAIAGMTIGFSFSLAMLLGPLFMRWMTVSGLFYIATLSGFIAIFILIFFVPIHQKQTVNSNSKSIIKLLCMPELAKLNLGICMLHALFTASFIIIPISLKQFNGFPSESQWLLYLPTLLIAFFITLTCVSYAERNFKFYFLSAIGLLGVAEFILWSTTGNLFFTMTGLCLFFAAFSMLEALLPSLVSRTAPPERKGSALGLFSCSQFLGIFIGGALGGWLFGQFSFPGVYLFCISLSLFWLALAFRVKPPQFLHKAPHPDFIRGQEQLQSE